MRSSKKSKKRIHLSTFLLQFSSSHIVYSNNIINNNFSHFTVVYVFCSFFFFISMNMKSEFNYYHHFDFVQREIVHKHQQYPRS